MDLFPNDIHYTPFFALCKANHVLFPKTVHWKKKGENFLVIKVFLFLQFGQMVVFSGMMKPQWRQVIGCWAPMGAPQAVQVAFPTGLAAPQYSQLIRRSLADNSNPLPKALAPDSKTFQTSSVSCKYSTSWAISSKRPKRLTGLRKVASAE